MRTHTRAQVNAVHPDFVGGSRALSAMLEKHQAEASHRSQQEAIIAQKKADEAKPHRREMRQTVIPTRCDRYVTAATHGYVRVRVYRRQYRRYGLSSGQGGVSGFFSSLFGEDDEDAKRRAARPARRKAFVPQGQPFALKGHIPAEVWLGSGAGASTYTHARTHARARTHAGTCTPTHTRTRTHACAHSCARGHA
jgi:hypothetical protein